MSVKMLCSKQDVLEFFDRPSPFFYRSLIRFFLILQEWKSGRNETDEKIGDDYKVVAKKRESLISDVFLREEVPSPGLDRDRASGAYDEESDSLYYVFKGRVAIIEMTRENIVNITKGE